MAVAASGGVSSNSDNVVVCDFSSVVVVLMVSRGFGCGGAVVETLEEFAGVEFEVEVAVEVVDEEVFVGGFVGSGVESED